MDPETEAGIEAIKGLRKLGYSVEPGKDPQTLWESFSPMQKALTLRGWELCKEDVPKEEKA